MIKVKTDQAVVFAVPRADGTWELTFKHGDTVLRARTVEEKSRLTTQALIDLGFSTDETGTLRLRYRVAP